MPPAPASLPQASAWFQHYDAASSAEELVSELSLQSRRVRKCPSISPGGHDQHASAKRVHFFSAQRQMPCPNAYLYSSVLWSLLRRTSKLLKRLVCECESALDDSFYGRAEGCPTDS